MDLSSYISFLVKADISDKNSPVFVLTDDSVYPVGVMPSGFFNITQPDGLVRVGNMTSPDITPSSLIASIALRLDGYLKLQQGDYTIQYTISAAGYDDTVLSRTFNVAFTEPVISLTKIFDLFTPSLSYYDATVYNAGIFSSVVTRSWGAVIGTVGNTTGGNSASFDLKYGGSYYDAAYKVTFSASVLYQSLVYSYLSILDALTKEEDSDVYAPPSSSQLLTYLTALKTKLDSLINSCQKYDKAKEDYEYAYTLYTHAQKRICAGDKVGVITYIQEILKIYHNNVVTNPEHTNEPISAYVYDCGSMTVTTATPFILEVFAGTAEAITAGIVVGETVFTNILIKNKNVAAIRGSLPLPGIPTTDSSSFYTKVYTDDFLTFSDPIQDGEYIKIYTL